MKNLWFAVVMLLLLTTCTQDGSEIPGLGQVTFKSVSIESFSGNLPNGRMAGPSTWEHVFLPWVEMIITNKVTGAEYSMFFNPNDFGEGFSISLPYGSYRFKSGYQAGEISLYLPFKVEGEFNLGVSSLEISMEGMTDYGLITLKKDFVSEAVLKGESWEYGMWLTDDMNYYIAYVRKDQVVQLIINESIQNTVIKRDIQIEPYVHYNFFLKLTEGNGNANFIELAIGQFESIERWIEIGENDSDFFTDPRDGEVYKIVKIGDQVWFAENLKYATGICYDNQAENCEEFGYLYQGAPECPLGWHVPSKAEWEILINHLGGSEEAGGKLKSVEGWNEPNVGATNETGFSALPGGRFWWDLCCSDEGEFFGKGENGFWWSSTYYSDGAMIPTIYHFLLRLDFQNNSASIVKAANYEISEAYSCRCVRD